MGIDYTPSIRSALRPQSKIRVSLTDQLRTISKEVSNQYKRTLLRGGEIVMSLVGNPGQVAIVPSILSGANIARQAALIRLRRSVDSRFVYYFLRSPQGQEALGAHSRGSVQQVINLRDLKTVAVPTPPLPEQRAIAHILGTLDDKIELNRRRNQTLEAMARALFKDWFVDFGPVRRNAARGGNQPSPGLRPPSSSGRGFDPNANAQHPSPSRRGFETAAHELPSPTGRGAGGEGVVESHTFDHLFPGRLDDEGKPEGWKMVPASELIEFNPTEPLRKGTPTPYLDMASLPTSGSWPEPPVIRDFGSGMRFRNGDTLLARITPCLENGKTALVQCLPDNAVGWGSTEYIVMRPKAPVPAGYAYLLARDDVFRAHAIRSMTGTSGRQRAQGDSVAAFKLASPLNESVWHTFAGLVTPIFDSIKSNATESEALAQLRDTLLPKLISGELRIADAGRFIEERTA